jgi:hypothetical protein
MDTNASSPPISPGRRLRHDLPDTAANVATAERLQSAAEAAWAHAEAAVEASVRRRSAQARPTPDAMERIEHALMRLEVTRSRREMRHADLEMERRTRARERETAELEEWIRGQAASMLADGWTPGELADIGIDARYTGSPSPQADPAPR